MGAARLREHGAVAGVSKDPGHGRRSLLLHHCVDQRVRGADAGRQRLLGEVRSSRGGGRGEQARRNIESGLGEGAPAGLVHRFDVTREIGAIEHRRAVRFDEEQKHVRAPQPAEPVRSPLQRLIVPPDLCQRLLPPPRGRRVAARLRDCNRYDAGAERARAQPASVPRDEGGDPDHQDHRRGEDREAASVRDVSFGAAQDSGHEHANPHEEQDQRRGQGDQVSRGTVESSKRTISGAVCRSVARSSGRLK